MTDTKQDGLDQRELLIEAILGVRSPDGKANVGIWGRKVCQVCGELGDYVGHWPAVASHMSRQFNCIAHGHAREEIPDRPWDTRYCEVCRRSLPTEELRQAGSQWICRSCDVAGTTDDERQTRLKRLASRRFLDERCADELSLLGWLNRQYSLAGGLAGVFDGGPHAGEIAELEDVRRLLGELAADVSDVADALRARSQGEGDDAVDER